MLRSVTAVCGTYFFFLIFAQFAFLELVQAAGAALEPTMGAMALGGLGASLGTAWLMRGRDLMVLLRAAFLACALTAAVAPWANRFWLVPLAAVIGASLGALTVALATSLTRLTGTRRFGLQLGMGVGLAYFLCNLPLVFQAPAAWRCWMASGFAALGLAAAMAAAPPACTPHFRAPRWSRALFGRKGLALVVLCFLALIWMDSALFYIIQQNPEYKSATWSSVRLWVNGPIHAGFAVMAGIAMDRGWFRPLPLLAYALLCGGSLVLIAGHEALGLASPLYVGGVSIYSVALIAYPSLWAEAEDLVGRAWRAAWLFGIAGWVGSGLGIGMARDLERIPIAFLVVAGAAIIAATWLVGRLGKALAVALCLLTVGCVDMPEKGLPAALGRRVYIAEGCINCHSQYVRPGTGDELLWGPVGTARGGAPPLYGNRRLGPDLTNVANRRSRDWQELHLRDPRAVTRHSTMPSYAHLFTDRRGADLLAYLDTLGSDTFAERLATVQAWHPQPSAQACAPTRALTLFAELCAGCHRTTALGGGAAARGLSPKPRDLEREALRYADATGADADALARLIKFGVLGTSMPGHEYLDDGDVLGLAAYVRELQRRQAL